MKAAFFDQSLMKLSGRNMIFQVKAPSSPRPVFPSKQTPRVREAQLFFPGKAASPRVSACAFASALVT